MPETKTPEEILSDFYEPETQSEKDGIILAMKEYARATAIGFAEWLAGLEGDDRIVLVDHQWYWETDTDGDQPLTEEQIWNLYEKSLIPSNKGE